MNYFSRNLTTALLVQRACLYLEHHSHFSRVLWALSSTSIANICTNRCKSAFSSLLKQPSVHQVYSRNSLDMAASPITTLERLKFDNLALRVLPIDKQKENFLRDVVGACFSRVRPTPVENPRLVVVSRPAVALLGLTESEVERPEFVEYFSGNRLLPSSETYAHCYCGHQFGYFAGQLGDGAAM